MNLTAKLKKWAVDNCDVDAEASDDDFKKAIADAIVKGTLSHDLLAKLSSTEEDEKTNEFADTIVNSLKSLADQLDKIEENGKTTKVEEKEAETEEETPEPEPVKKPVKRAPSALEKAVAAFGGHFDDMDEEKGFSIHVKEAAEQYSSTKSTMVYPETVISGDRVKAHPLAGRPMKSFAERGRIMETASEKDEAIAGAFAKFAVNAAKLKSRSIAFAQLPQHDKELLCYAMENEKWGGATDGGDYADIKDRKLTPNEQKALIDDAASGGLEAAPIVFDDMVIQTPLLHGELFPLVNTIPLDRGRRVEGVATGTVTGSWGGVDDSAISLFNTASYVTAFDTTIFRWEGAIRIGLDFLSDTPIDFGRHITSQYGERLLEDLDDVVASGNGTTQPEGVINKSGTTTVAWGGATSLGNYESLRFAVAKPEHRANLRNSIVFAGTEESYERARAIPVGSSDARRIFGLDYDSYSLMQRAYKINESLANTEVFYAVLARYRMYRRRGLVMRTSTEGDTLIRNNELLMVAMARYGGQLERGACAAKTTTAPA